MDRPKYRACLFARTALMVNGLRHRLLGRVLSRETLAVLPLNFPQTIDGHAHFGIGLEITQSATVSILQIGCSQLQSTNTIQILGRLS